MAAHDFDDLVSSGLLRAVEEIVVRAYRSTYPQASLADAYRWLRFEDPAPVQRLAEGVKRLRDGGVEFDSEAVDKACVEASKLGF